MYLLNRKDKRVSIKTKIFLGVGLFIILNIIINLLIVKLSINNIYIGLEKRELKNKYNLIKRNLYNEDKLIDAIYDANDNGIKVKVLDNNLNILYNIFNDNLTNRFTNLDLMLLSSLDDNKQSIIITLKNYKKNGYDLYLVGKVDNGYTIISSSIESIKNDAKMATIVLVLTSLITFVILLVIAYFISKMFGKKINEIKDVTDGIRELKFDKKIEVNSNDELGDLFNNVNEMSSKLEESIKNLEQANKKLKQDLDEKEKQEMARKKLIANISHEFKTPLTIISGYGQLLRDEVKDKDSQESANLIINEAEKLSELVYEFLELSKLESGSIALNKEEVDVNQLIDEELKKLSVRISNRKIKVEKDYVNGKNILVDKKQFSKVIVNLLTNAIKFCKYKKIIKIRTYVKEGYFYYEVFNTGDNIKDNDLENIFNSYYKDKSVRNKEGTGLGLTIVKAIVELHEGKCFVKNTSGGVCFWVSVKL